MEIHHVNQSVTHSYTLFNTQDNTDATADRDTSRSSVRYPHKHSLLNTQDNTDATADGDHLVHQSGTHIHTLPLILMIKTDATADGDTSYSSVRYTHAYTLFNTHDNTDATADGVTSCSSIRHTHTNTHSLSLSRSLILKIIQTPRQMKIHLVNQ